MKDTLYGFDGLIENFSAQDFLILEIILWKKKKI